MFLAAGMCALADSPLLSALPAALEDAAAAAPTAAVKAAAAAAVDGARG